MFREFPLETIYAYPPPQPIDSAEAAFAIRAGRLFAPEKGPLALYLHIPFCSSLCQFCGFIKGQLRDGTELDRYCDLILREFELLLSQFDVADNEICAVYFGGGTPSILSPRQVGRLLDFIHGRMRISPDAEVTFEGECGTLSKPGYLDFLSSTSFTRISFGVQTTNQDARNALNLKPSMDALTRLCEAAVRRFDDVAVDFIFGWPGQTDEMAAKDILTLANRLRPPKIEVFQFEYLDASPAFLRALRSAGFERASTLTLQRLDAVIEEQLGVEGYKRTGYTHYIRKDLVGTLTKKKSTYGDCYYGWSGGQVLGVGRGAQSFFRGAMWGCCMSPPEYEDAIAAGRLPISGLSTYQIGERERVTWPRRGWIPLSVALGGDADYSGKLTQMVDSGLVKVTDGRYILTALGRTWIPSIMSFLVPESSSQVFQAMTTERAHQRGQDRSP